VFTAAGAAPDGVYTPPEIHEVVLGYVRQQGLDTSAPDPRTLVLDPLLCDALYKGLVNVKAGERFPTHIAKVGAVM
jgi:translation initiation factor 2D